MNWIEEAEYRIKCCKARTPDGYGELHSLENFLGSYLNDRIADLQFLKKDMEERGKDSSIWTDKDVQELLDELVQLLRIKKSANELLKE